MTFRCVSEIYNYERRRPRRAADALLHKSLLKHHPAHGVHRHAYGAMATDAAVSRDAGDVVAARRAISASLNELDELDSVKRNCLVSRHIMNQHDVVSNTHCRL